MILMDIICVSSNKKKKNVLSSASLKTWRMNIVFSISKFLTNLECMNFGIKMSPLFSIKVIIFYLYCENKNITFLVDKTSNFRF